jgi:hypothetical protein
MNTRNRDSIERLTTSQIILRSKNGSVKIVVDDSGNLKFSSANNSNTGSFSIDLKNEKISTKKIEFIKDNSSFTSSLNVSSADSSNSSDTKFDPSTGRLIEDFLPSDFNDIRDNALEAIGKFDPSGLLKDINLNQDLLINITKGVTAHDKFDITGKLPQENIHDSILDNIVKGVTAHGKFDADGRLPAVNIHTDVVADITKGVTANGKFGADGRLPAVNIHADVVANIVKGVTAHDDVANLDFSLDNSNPDIPVIRMSRGSRGFATTTFSKNHIGLSNVDNKSSLSIRNEITVDTTTGKLLGIGTADIIVNNENTFADTRFTTVQSTANTANTLSNSIEGRFSGGKLLETNLETTTVTKIINGNSAHSDLNSADISIDTSGKIQFNRGGSRGSSTGTTVTKSHIGLPLVENKSVATIKTETFADSIFTTIQSTANTANTLSNTIEGRFSDGLLKATNAAADLRNSNISIAQASSGQITLTLGASIPPIAINPLSTTTFTSVQTAANTANTLSNTIEARFTNNLLNTANAAADLRNSNLSFAQGSDGTITLARGGGLSSVTVNPLSTTTFTNVQTAANTANSTANTINNRFDINGKIKSINLSDDNNGFKFTTSNKLKIGIGQAETATNSSGAAVEYDSDSDLEIVTGSTGIPDIAILKAQAQGNLVIGQVNFKGWDGAQSQLNFNGQAITSNRSRFSPRSTIQATTDINGGGRIDFFTATGALYNAFSFPAETPTTPTVRMRISANGNIGINTTSPTQDLDINGTMRLRQLVAGSSAGGIGRTSTGEIVALASDQRLKKDINTITGSLNSVCSLRGVTYKWDDTRFNNFIIDDIEKEKIQIGLIAQEVETVLPELVYNNGIEDLKAVKYAEIVAVLIEAVKELKQKNEQTESSLLQLIIKLSGSNII